MGAAYIQPGRIRWVTSFFVPRWHTNYEYYSFTFRKKAFGKFIFPSNITKFQIKHHILEHYFQCYWIPLFFVNTGLITTIFDYRRIVYTDTVTRTVKPDYLHPCYKADGERSHFQEIYNLIGIEKPLRGKASCCEWSYHISNSKKQLNYLTSTL